jgi:hypothetical protein
VFPISYPTSLLSFSNNLDRKSLNPVAAIGNLGSQFPTVLSFGENAYRPETHLFQQHFSHLERRLMGLTTHLFNYPWA